MPEEHKKFILHIYEDAVFDTQLREVVEESEYFWTSEPNFDKALEHLNPQIKLIVISNESLNKSMTDFFKNIKSSQYNNISIIAIVSTKENIYTKNMMKYGYNDYISKENSPEIIAGQIIDFLDKRDTATEKLDQIRIGIIDDDVFNNQLVKRALEVKGIKNIQIFKSGEEFFNAPTESDVYMVDIVMQKISGIRVVQKIRELYPSALILVVSSVSEDKLVTTALMKGADDFIKKPINLEIFLAKILSRKK